jgi:phosphate transport system protein
MKRFYDTELETFRSQLILMGEKAIEHVWLSLRALTETDPELARRVIATDDEIDNLEIAIDDEAMRYMNLRAPIATELRVVIVGMKASHDLERVGDEATGIAKRALRLAAEPPLTAATVAEIGSLNQMAMMAQQMLREALDCLLESDNEEKALAVIRRDREVDKLNKQLYRALTAHAAANPGTINRVVELMFISKSLERIADHATNIAEEMVYLTQAKDIRHTPEVRTSNPQQSNPPIPK